MKVSWISKNIYDTNNGRSGWYKKAKTNLIRPVTSHEILSWPRKLINSCHILLMDRKLVCLIKDVQYENQVWVLIYSSQGEKMVLLNVDSFIWGCS